MFDTTPISDDTLFILTVMGTKAEAEDDEDWGELLRLITCKIELSFVRAFANASDGSSDLTVDVVDIVITCNNL